MLKMDEEFYNMVSDICTQDSRYYPEASLRAARSVTPALELMKKTLSLVHLPRPLRKQIGRLRERRQLFVSTRLLLKLAQRDQTRLR